MKAQANKGVSFAIGDLMLIKLQPRRESFVAKIGV